MTIRDLRIYVDHIIAVHKSMPISSGTRLGPYEVVAALGAGRMGEVWRGRETRLDRSVAIKILPASFASNAQRKIRFEREARAISQLNHPNICTLYDVGDSYLVMELLEGESLADRLVKGPLPLEQVLRYGTQIADALDKAHRQGIIHRDLKPGNIMLTKSGAKLLDFGLAKDSVGAGVLAGSAASEGPTATLHKPLTEEGTIVGTFQYMAPEQLEGLPADARTDIFGFGAVLYEMATAHRAFEGKTKTSLIAAIVSSEPAPMSKLQPLTPPALEHVVRKCLAKDPDDRWQSAHDVAEELRWISEAGSQAGVAMPLAMRRKSRERLGWAAGGTVALIAGAFASHRLWHEPKPQYRFTIPMIDSGYRFGSAFQLSPDGRTIYFVANNNANKRQAFRRGLNELNAGPIEGTEDIASLFRITPDGRGLLMSYAGAILKRISVDGGAVEVVAEGVPGGTTATAVAPDGTILIGNHDFPIRRVLPSRGVEDVMPLDKTHAEVGQNWPWFLPDGKHYLFLSVARDPGRGVIRYTLCATSLGSKDVIRIGEVPSRVEYAAGHLFFVREGTLMAEPFDSSRFKFTGEAMAVLGNVPFSSRTGLASFEVTQNGTIACGQTGATHRFVWVDATGKKAGMVGNPFSWSGTWAFPSMIAVLPNGDRLVTSVYDHRAGTAFLWLLGLTRETATRVTFSPALEMSPVVTPDGSRVFF